MAIFWAKNAKKKEFFSRETYFLDMLIVFFAVFYLLENIFMSESDQKMVSK